MIREVKLDLKFNHYCEPPQTPKRLMDQAAAGDDATMAHWADIWLERIKENKAHFGSFKEHSIGQIWGKFRRQPIIIVGSGPSLKHNVDALKNTNGIPIVSCLHNYHFLEDRGVKVDYYVTVDSGDITLTEMAEGGSKSLEEYLESTKDKTLLAATTASSKLLKAWKGKVLFFNCMIPSEELTKKIDEVEKFWVIVAVGGTVLGASFYISKYILGGNTIIFTGADFAFDYDASSFHSWKSQYDGKVGQAMRVTDIFGNKVLTWQSYWGFKCYFDQLALRLPGVYVNATEGGILGAYETGNIPQIHQMTLSDAIAKYSIGDSDDGFLKIKEACLNPDTVETRWVAC